ncbi:NADPH dehydrogenase NamA [Paenibacillus aurantius]|uniref:NADPH dehydrogenase n=1 Tax=Paenibacillus aurantius TaxID=2918900 RepID=A0AA96LA09_9BACL|nr:NADPH dehydrogenase NamA [Paenibacillus aurantius]WNQ09435.1 NADPH dehydrogenase NamA [Paenibacillus aurantius]
MSQLFTPFPVRGVTLKNRIVMSPMCMYSSTNKDGRITNWHRTHYTSRAVGQVGLIVVEASAVTPQGRISEQDLGIWSDDHLEGLKELVDLVHEQDAHIGIQLAHAGRKAVLPGEIVAPSAVAFGDMKAPVEMTIGQIQETKRAFKDAAVRAKTAGFDVIELHAAHGYLLNEFLSPLANKRTDAYGGNADNRYRLLSEIIDEVRQVWEGPLFVRISAHEYLPEGLTPEDYIPLAIKMKEQGVDLIDCSSGGVAPAKIDSYPGYQVPFAETLKREAGVATGAVGLITSPIQAEEILKNGRADLIFLARELLRDPYWPRTAAKELRTELKPPVPYERGW